MRDPGNIREVAQHNPDYMGFIFYQDSPRFVGNTFVLPEGFPDTIRPVGVFVNEDTGTIEKYASRIRAMHVQLHGRESVDQCAALKDKGYHVIKVISVDDATDFSVTQLYEKVVDYFLFDTKGKYFGGNARTFTWEILKRYDQQVPFFLSGGLTPENIEHLDVLEGMNIHALDMNSGVEVSPGLKDEEKIKTVKSILYAEQ